MPVNRGNMQRDNNKKKKGLISPKTCVLVSSLLTYFPAYHLVSSVGGTKLQRIEGGKPGRIKGNWDVPSVFSSSTSLTIATN